MYYIHASQVVNTNIRIYIFLDGRRKAYLCALARMKLLNLRRRSMDITLGQKANDAGCFPRPTDTDDPAGEHALAARCRCSRLFSLASAVTPAALLHLLAIESAQKRERS